MSPDRRPGGEQTRFTRLAETAGPRILAYLARRIDPPGDAADVLAEVLAIAWRRVADLPADEGEAAAWLFGIARGTLANHRRGQARRHALADRLRDHLAHRQREAERRPTRLLPSATRSAGWPLTTGSCSPWSPGTACAPTKPQPS